MMKRPLTWASSLLLFLPQSSHGFGLVADVIHHAPPVLDHALHSATTTLQPLAAQYQQALQSDPLTTQMATGVVLAIAGDAIAQKRDDAAEYNVQRATSFAAFDGVYRAAQHFLYPPMIATCQGHVLGPFMAHDSQLAAALEQALVSQLVIIPLVYYPVFFAVTGAVQGLTPRQTLERALQSFWPLMLRNWAFWIPVQFGVFVGVPDEAAQISILIACGLVWTVILSVLAGQAKEEEETTAEQPAVVPPPQPMAETVPVQAYFPEEQMKLLSEDRLRRTPAFLRSNSTSVAEATTRETQTAI